MEAAQLRQKKVLNEPARIAVPSVRTVELYLLPLTGQLTQIIKSAAAIKHLRLCGSPPVAGRADAHFQETQDNKR